VCIRARCERIRVLEGWAETIDGFVLRIFIEGPTPHMAAYFKSEAVLVRPGSPTRTQLWAPAVGQETEAGDKMNAHVLPD
jgi:hypothetical protein